MQTEAVLEVDSLKQVAIFQLSSQIRSKLEIFYPEMSLEKVDFAIVLSQSCDLVKRNNNAIELSHITIAYLEPLSKYLETVISLNELTLRLSVHDSKMILLNRDTFMKRAKSDLTRVVQNNHKWLFFISLNLSNSFQYFFINLTKTLPIRTEHYELLINSVKYQMVDGFDKKLGWKMANLYGRVGTEDYSDEQISDLMENFFVETKNITKANEINDELYAKVVSYNKKLDQAKLNSILTSLKRLDGEYK